jgi:hypothetical protein
MEPELRFGQDLGFIASKSLVCLFFVFYLPVLKHSFQGLVRELDGNENKNKNIDINYK